MSDKTTAEIAERVSLLMQIDRNHREISSKVDMAALAGVPAHIAAVFEEANAVSGNLTPAQAYALINKRVSEIQAQLYLMRLELENRDPRDPASVYADPMLISAYGARIEGLKQRQKRFSFGPEILADGWYPMEVSDKNVSHRWMRPCDVALACVPHLGPGAQTLKISGYVMHAGQMDSLAITAAEHTAEIEITEKGTVTRFTATLTLTAEDVKDANYLPVEFRLTDFRTPNDVDQRPLGANIHEFTLAATDGAADTAS